MERPYVKSTPPPQRGRVARAGSAVGFVRHLRDHPGEWFEYQPDVTHSSSIANHLRKRYGLEVRMKKVTDEPRRYRVWARAEATA